MSRHPLAAPFAAAIAVLALAACSSATRSPSPTPDPTPSASVSAAEPTPALEPPAAMLATGGTSTRGMLGTFTWRGTGSDSPWLPGTAVTVDRAAPLEVSFDPATAVARWTAKRASVADRDGHDGVVVADGVGPVRIPSLPSGAWTLAIEVDFGELGTAVYSWQVDVR